MNQKGAAASLETKQNFKKRLIKAEKSEKMFRMWKLDTNRWLSVSFLAVSRTGLSDLHLRMEKQTWGISRTQSGQQTESCSSGQTMKMLRSWGLPVRLGTEFTTGKSSSELGSFSFPHSLVDQIELLQYPGQGVELLWNFFCFFFCNLKKHGNWLEKTLIRKKLIAEMWYNCWDVIQEEDRSWEMEISSSLRGKLVSLQHSLLKAPTPRLTNVLKQVWTSALC